MRVLVCGGRDYSNIDKVNEELNKLDISVIIEGGANGADTLAAAWAVERPCPLETFEADWTTHGKKAGILRNIKMLTEGKPDLVVAFPGGKGTAHMVKIAKEAGIEVKEIV